MSGKSPGKRSIHMSCKYPSAAFKPVIVHGLLLLCLVILAGCAVGPNYQPVQTSVPESWAGPVPGAGPSVPDEIRWWTAFDDPVLSALVERAIAFKSGSEAGVIPDSAGQGGQEHCAVRFRAQRQRRRFFSAQSVLAGSPRAVIPAEPTG